MMFTTLVTKLAGRKAKVLAGTAIAGAALMMAAPAAQAQRVVLGVRIGRPAYVAPAPVYVAPAPTVVYTGPGYYGGVYFRDYDTWHSHFYRNDRDDRDRHVDRNHDHRFDRR